MILEKQEQNVMEFRAEKEVKVTTSDSGHLTFPAGWKGDLQVDFHKNVSLNGRILGKIGDDGNVFLNSGKKTGLIVVE